MKHLKDNDLVCITGESFGSLNDVVDCKWITKKEYNAWISKLEKSYIELKTEKGEYHAN